MKFLHVQDSPDSKYGREWRWRPTVTWYRRSVFLAWELQLIRREGKECEPRIVGDYAIAFHVNPLKWTFKPLHLYYDGPHCFWNFGPITFIRGGLGWCTKCHDDA